MSAYGRVLLARVLPAMLAILASERTHFDKASAILDSNSKETKRGPRE